MNRYAGLHFSGAQIMHISPYTGETSFVTINFKHSMSLVVKVEHDGTKMYLISKSASNKTDHKFAFGIDANRQPFIELHMPSIFKSGVASDEVFSFGAAGVFPIAKEWRTIGYTIDVNGTATSQKTTAIAYINGVAVATKDWVDRYVKDAATNTWLVGGRYTAGAVTPSYKGFIYNYNVYNYLRTPAQITAEAALIGAKNSPSCECV
jgi:hypothetical protein